MEGLGFYSTRLSETKTQNRVRCSNTGKIQMYLREELNRRSHSTKARLSYQCASLNFCPSTSQHASPLYATTLWKCEDLPFAHKVTRLRSKPRPLRAVQRKRHLELSDAPPDFPPVKATLNTHKNTHSSSLVS